MARTPEERTAQWEARHHAYWALVNMHPGHTYMITDTAVPLARLPESIAHAQQLLGEHGPARAASWGMSVTATSTRWWRWPPMSTTGRTPLAEQLVHHALALGGTASGEHGIGLVKRTYMAAEHGAALDWMRRLKALFDPHGLLNPGKIV